MDYLDYVYFESWTCNPTTLAMLDERLRAMQDIVKHKAIPVANSDCGDYMFNMASLLLACEPGKCHLWFWNIPSDNVLDAINNIKLGNPKGAYKVQSDGCRTRDWDNGLVAVNPKESGDCTAVYDGTNHILAPRSGNIFMKQ